MSPPRPPPLLPQKLLFICSRNKIRSLTAEKLFEGVPGYQVRSAGTQPEARIVVTAGHLGWADLIFVMEKSHLRRLREKYPDALESKQVVTLHIPDEYVFMQRELVEELRGKLEGMWCYRRKFERRFRRSTCHELRSVALASKPETRHAHSVTTTTTSPLFDEYRYYLDHLSEMVERYEGKVVVIKDQQVIGTFERDLTAIAETKKHHAPGTFLVHRVRREEKPWILSPVYFEQPRPV